MAEEKFELVSNYAPTGDQPQAITQLVKGVQRGDRCQTLLGVTGSGKTFTMANVIAQCNRPTLVLAHNKTLAAQLCTEFRSFFPNNAVEYFVSYYDYYQPEAYIPSTDTYIEKDSAINDEIDRLRHSATAALSERRDVIIVASVSCIYSLGDPIDYRSMVISLRPGMQMERDELCKKLVTLQYERNDVNFARSYKPDKCPPYRLSRGNCRGSGQCRCVRKDCPPCVATDRTTTARAALYSARLTLQQAKSSRTASLSGKVRADVILKAPTFIR